MSTRGAHLHAVDDVGACKANACRASVRWARTVDGAWVPLDVDRDPDGAWTAVQRRRGEWRLRKVDPDETLPDRWPRYTAHWTTCAAPQSWQAERLAADPASLTIYGGSRQGHGMNSTDLLSLHAMTVGSPCAGCYKRNSVRAGTGTLCPGCREILEAWRADPHRTTHIPYPRWNESTGKLEPRRTHMRHLQTG